jgi:hypothetical protein
VAREALGFRFTVTSADAGLLDLADDAFSALPPASRADSSLDLDGYDLTVAGNPLTALLGDVTIRAITAAGGNLLLHAGAVAAPDGSCTLVCGASGSGKSTLTAGLVRSGLAYVTDETVCLDPQTLRITPFRRPLSVKPGSQTVLSRLRPEPPYDGNWVIPPARLGGPDLPAAPLLPDLAVFPSYVPGAPCELVPISAGEAAFLAGTNSSRLNETAGGALPALARLFRRVPALRLVHGDLDSAVERLRSRWAAAA